MADSQLRDIGIGRSDILYVARTLVYADHQLPSVTTTPSSSEDWLEHARAA